MKDVLKDGIITQIGLGDLFTVARADDGALYSWGANNLGLPKGGLKNKRLVQIAAGSRHTVALTSDGALYVWGSNSCGMLKIGMFEYRKFPHEVEKNDILKDKNITHMTAGSRHTTVLTSDGQIYSWGLSDFGIPISVENRPARLSMNGLLNGKTVSQFVVNDDYMIALTKDEKVGYWDVQDNSSTWVRTSNVDPEYSITSLFLSMGSMGFLGLTCEQGYYGQDCELFNCFGIDSTDEKRVCSGNGFCVDLDTCRCIQGYSGLNCSYPVCHGHSSMDKRVCSTYGTCQSPNKCVCNYGYHGETCASNLRPLWTLPIFGMLLFMALLIVCIVVGLQVRRRRREEQMKSELKACLLAEMNEYDIDDNIERGDFYIDMKEIKLISRISEGAFGVVFKGEWKSNLVAVKKMKVSDDESFIKEVSILQSLRHPNILYLYGYSSNDSGDKFLITEFAVNGSLDKLLHKGNQSLKAFDQKMNILCQIADTMAYLHGKNPRIVHRDLKPQNILMGENYHVRICDFGLSKVTDSSFTMGRSYGTVEYCAPELLTHQGYDERVDTFSFGIIMHEIFILAPPYSQHEYSSVFTLGLDIVKGLRPPLRFDPFSTESNDAQTLVDFFSQSNTTNMLPSDIPLVVQDFYRLVTRCWDADLSKRPSFGEITTELDAIKKRSSR